MNYITSIFSEALLTAAGWTVLHSIWMGLMVLLCVVSLQTILGKNNSKLKYHIAFGGQLVLLTLAVSTFFFYYVQPQQANIGEVFFTGETQAGFAGAQSFIQQVKYLIASNTASVAVIWFIGMVFLMLKMVVGYRYVHLMRKKSWIISDASINKLVENIRMKLDLDISCEIRSTKQFLTPILTGVFKPFILLPLAVINSLDMDEVELILAHEMAHLKRYDHVAIFIQQIMETILYFNPAIWLLSAQLNRYREEACDDLVVSVMGKEINYAKSLYKLQELHATKHQGAMVLSALGRKNQLLNRIKRIMNIENNQRFNFGRMSLLLLLPLAFVLLSFYAKHEAKAEHEQLDKLEARNILVDYAPEELTIDTVPEPRSSTKIIEKITKKENGRKVEAEFEGDEIRYLKIDGLEVDPDSNPEVVEELKDELVDNHSIQSYRSYNFGSNDGDEEEFNFDFDELGEGMGQLFESLGQDMEGLFENLGQDVEGIFENFEVEGLENGMRFNMDGNELFKWEGGDNDIIMKWNTDGDEQLFEWKGNGNGEDFELFFNGESMKMQEFMDKMKENGEYFIHDYHNNMPQWLEEDGNFILRHHGGDEDVIILRGEEMERLQKNAERMAEKYTRDAERYAEQWEENARAMERNAEEREDAARELRSHLEEMKESQKERQKELKRNYKDAYKNKRSYRYSSRNTMSLKEIIQKELKNDGFMSQGGSYTFKLKENKLKINGKKQPQAVYEKYKNLYEQHTGSGIQGSTYSSSTTGI